MKDCSIWCGSKDNISKSHLIPEYLGGKFSPNISCEKCNNYLGKFEALAKDNVFVTAAMVKLGLAKRREAYNKHTIIDEETGFEFKFNQQDIPEIIPKPIGSNGYQGSLPYLKKTWKTKLRREKVQHRNLSIKMMHIS